MLELQGISRSVGGKVHIHPTNLTLQKGSMNVLLGPTLAGKTSLMRLMAGLDQPTTGRILWDGSDVTGQRVQDRGVAMVYQQFINYPGLTVYENIASPLRILGRPRDEIDRKVRETADMLHLTPMLGRKPLELSGGQQQRCALARALVKGAGLVLLDEPLANLDYKLREELRVEIPRIFEASGAIFVYATTEPEEALLLGGNTATLWQGRITQFGPTPIVYRQPVDATTARVFSDPPMNFVAARKQDGAVTLGDSQLPAGSFSDLPDGACLAGFRANHLSLTRPGPAAVEFTCTLAATEITGSETFVHVEHGADRWVGLVEGVHLLTPGQPLSVWLDPAHVYLFDASERLVVPAAYALAG
ncbi:ATP-binding cassette domain-containing protein [Paracoccus kondratievae]|uniref:ABC transporter ATP-binding protein n=1 Tax=Paracoccus kondratievae TaxID=135740 RepID=A0AAD3NZ44_9RHOB|nr:MULTISPECIES: ABC transporter ATP-binding protein [Paracoccus]QFQ87045.1 ATP-binding cassette domain-containing protein [Paracoccus kondratievae]GLK64219.1 ABC transporter ATP-binding protein [Paracoccus kondratievae]